MADLVIAYEMGYTESSALGNSQTVLKFLPKCTRPRILKALGIARLNIELEYMTIYSKRARIWSSEEQFLGCIEDALSHLESRIS